MKQVLYVNLIIFIILVLSFSTSSARLLPQRGQADAEEVKTSNTPYEGSFMKLQEDDDMFHLMGLEECTEMDEDCASRRMVAEAHLDYIYTQHHKPKALP